MKFLNVASGSNDLLITAEGDEYIDLGTSTGAVFMGHANPRINEHIVQQLGRVSCTWMSFLEIQDQCAQAVARHIPDDLKLYSLYSTGTEAVEVAMRMAFELTGRPGALGFHTNFHGKSVAAQNLARRDPNTPMIDMFHRLPFVPQQSEEEVLERASREIGRGQIAAVFVEPVQGQGGGYSASRDFYLELSSLCRENEVLIVCDEVFTGFYRTGPCFHYPELGLAPDIVVAAKALANGFPASAVLLTRSVEFHPKDFRFNSTYSGNPLACAAVIGTLAEMERVGVSDLVANIERKFASLELESFCEMRLYGACCFLQFDSAKQAETVYRHLFEKKIAAVKRFDVLCLWPSATITPEHLDHVVTSTNEALAASA